MTTQLDLFSEHSIQSRFEAFHRENPWVYFRLLEMTWDLAHRGRDRIGMGMLFEVLRWEYAMRTHDPASEFRLNNSYRSRYARLIMKSEPRLRHIFEVRELRSK